MLFNYLILCRPLLLPPSIFPSIRVFSNESVLCTRWPKHWSFSFSISPSNEYLGLISFRMGWLDLLAVQETLKSFLQNYSLKASILQLSFLYSPTHIHTCLLVKPQFWLDGPLLAKYCLCFLICCLFDHSFSSKEQSSFNFMAAFTICSDFGDQIKVSHCFHCFSIYLPWSNGTRCHGLTFLDVEF